MKIVCIKGGLGNQMFEYCRYRQLAETHDGGVHLYLDNRRTKEHGGCLLDKCFSIEKPRSAVIVSAVVALLKLCRSVGVGRSLWDDERESAVLIDDFSQDKQFIANASDVFRFRDFSLLPCIADYEKSIRSRPLPVSLHIRRGDYLHPSNFDNFGVCDISYYERAMQAVGSRWGNAHYFVFSDDTTWAKSNIQSDAGNVTFVDCGDTTPDYTEMYLMTLCKAHIIANSTFSFWGAYLSNANLLTVYPKKWYSNKHWTRPNIFPHNWISM